MNISEEYLIKMRVEIGAKIKAAREAKRLTQEQVGELISQNKNTINNIETGKWNYDIKFLILVAIIVGCKIELVPID